MDVEELGVVDEVALEENGGLDRPERQSTVNVPNADAVVIHPRHAGAPDVLLVFEC